MLIVLLFVIAFVLVFFSCEIKTSTVRLSVIGIADAIHARIKKGQWPKYWISYKSKIRKPARTERIRVAATEPETIALVEREILLRQARLNAARSKRAALKYAESLDSERQKEDTKPTNL